MMDANCSHRITTMLGDTIQCMLCKEILTQGTPEQDKQTEGIVDVIQKKLIEELAALADDKDGESNG